MYIYVYHSSTFHFELFGFSSIFCRLIYLSAGNKRRQKTSVRPKVVIRNIYRYDLERPIYTQLHKRYLSALVQFKEERKTAD